MSTVQAGHQLPASAPVIEKRRDARRELAVPGRLTWKDRSGASRFATVVTRDVSEYGVLVDCVSRCAIPLFRLVDLQVDRSVRSHPEPDLPAALRRSQVPAAVYRIGPYSDVTGTPQSYALRLLVKPCRRTEAAGRVPEHHMPAAAPQRHTA